MAVRQFDGVDDDIIRSAGALSGMGAGTIATLFKPAAGGSFLTMFCPHDEGGAPGIQLFIDTDVDRPGWWPSMGSAPYGDIVLLPGVWYLLVVRKEAAGAAQRVPRFSVHDYSTQTWSHIGGDNDTRDADPPGAGGTVRFSWDDDDYWSGRVAVQAAWSNTLRWTPDSSGDADIEAAGLESSLAAWLDAEPDALWAFNQASTGDPVEDLTEGGADQVAISGTSVVTDDDPPGFDFSLDDGDDHTGTGETATLILTAGDGDGTPAAVGTGETVTVTVQAGQGTGAASVTGTGQAVELVLTAGQGVGTGVDEHTGTGQSVSVTLTPGGGVGTAAVAGTGETVTLLLVPGIGSPEGVQEPEAIIVGNITGPAARTQPHPVSVTHVDRTASGTAVARNAAGVATARRTGGAARRVIFTLDGPTRRARPTPDGPDTSRTVTGPGH